MTGVQTCALPIYEEARRVVTEFVEQIQNLLNQREIVTLPNIGRLYKNYMQKIQFLPVANNFNAASYGLPPLQFSPIARSREVIEPVVTPVEPPVPVAETPKTPVLDTAAEPVAETWSPSKLPDPPVKPIEVAPPPAFTPPPVASPPPHVVNSASIRIFPIVATILLLKIGRAHV